MTALADGVRYDAQAKFAGYFAESSGRLVLESVAFLDPVPDRARVRAVVGFSVRTITDGVFRSQFRRLR